MTKIHSSQTPSLDLAAIRSRLSAKRGPDYWRSLEEIADTEEFQEFLHREFPSQAAQLLEPVDRRRFLRLMGASLALAGIGACTRQPDETILPYVQAPEEIVPGKPLFFASAFTLGGFATGILVESHMGRPTKIEGNPRHPASLGATDALAQASLLDLYDPDRSQVVSQTGQISTWNTFLQALQTEMEVQQLKQGAGLRLLTETITSPTLGNQIRELLSRFPKAKWHQYEPIGRDSSREGARLAFGELADTQYRFDRADVVLALDADFLTFGPGHLRYARDFTGRRRINQEQADLNRLYVVESTPSSTGAMADHRLPLRPQEIETFIRSLARLLGIEVSSGPMGRHEQWITELARDLEKHRGTSLVIPGEQQPPVVHGLAHAINHRLGNVTRTVLYTDPVEDHPVNQLDSLQELVQDMKTGQVDVIAVIGGNPVFDAPADLEFSRHFSNVRQRIHLGLYADETSALCHWHIPAAHYLETWSDARAYDGTVSIIQPLIAPLYGGKSAHELVNALGGANDRSSYVIVRDHWESVFGQEDFEQLWQRSLHDGTIQGTTLPQKQVSLHLEVPPPTAPMASTSEHLEIVFRPDPTIYDGRFANNGWLQELPKPLTKLTWDNAALMSLATAESLGLANQELVELHHQGQSVKAPVWIMAGHLDNSVTLHLGYGRTRSGQLGNDRGFNAYSIRTSGQLWFGSGLEIRKTGTRYPLASTQHHHLIDLTPHDRTVVEGRPLIRSATLEEYRKNPHFAQEMGHPPSPEQSLYPPHQYEGYSWGMAINLNACTGCNACVMACQAENNIPVVGKEEVQMGREMHWIRIDRHYKGNLQNPETYHQPVLCMHCENAPCEPVCPVGATVHGQEGLNQMVYNRCVGTRYCSNNCPYKVRRFNFMLYSDFETPSLKLLHNPDVTVRSRGVMEKCTYCVQRINAARIEAKKENRKIKEGEVLTACQQVCPTEAIVFGNLNDPASRVSQMKSNPLNYGLLEELNTRPRTTYWARLRNPIPELETED